VLTGNGKSLTQSKSILFIMFLAMRNLSLTALVVAFLACLQYTEALLLQRHNGSSNLGALCWDGCAGSGYCDFCGAGNLCCRKDWQADPDECYNTTALNQREHECVAPAQSDWRVSDSDDMTQMLGATKGRKGKIIKAHDLQDPDSITPETAGDMAGMTVDASDLTNTLQAAVSQSQDLAQQEAQESVIQVQGSKSLAVFVFSRVDGIQRRSEIRSMWQGISQSPNVALSYSFVVCDHTAEDSESLGFFDLSAEVQTQLLDELATHKDVLYLECQEGYGSGALTKKVLASMKYFQAKLPADYFMKVDDDTFIAWSRYEPQLLKSGTEHLYMGIPIGEGVPCRQEGFRWYEPYDTFPGELFPKGMSGGSGYTIGKHLIKLVVDLGIGEANVLYNEDRAVGVWMDTLKKSGHRVDYTGVPGIDGFWAWNWRKPSDNWMNWIAYPYTLHHGLEGQTIACLAEADRANDETRELSACFHAEEGKDYQPLKCAALNKDAMQAEHLMRTPAFNTSDPPTP